MILLPLTAVHDTLKPGDEPCTVLVTVTPFTLVGSCGVDDGGGDCVVVMCVAFGVDRVTVVSSVEDILLGSVINATNTICYIINSVNCLHFYT